MKELLFGLRLLFGSGRKNRVRFALMALGSSVGVCCLAIVLTIPGILGAQDARVAARQPVDAPSGAGDSFPLLLERADPFGSQALSRIFLARGAKAVEPPPGLKTFPERGEVFVSPRLRDLLLEQPELGQRLPGREKGVIGRQGLARPDELVAYVGMSRAELPDGSALTGFGGPDADVPLTTMDPSMLDNLRFTLACVVLLPLVVFLSVCARLSAAERARRLAALRLLGMSISEVQRVNAAETVAAAGLGAVLGVGEFWALNQFVSRIGLPGFRWYPDDGALTGPTLVACLVGCPALAWFVGRASARKAAANPLAVRRTAAGKPPSVWGVLPLVGGAGIATVFCAAGATGHVLPSTRLTTLLMPSAVVLLGVGLVTTLPPLCRFVAQRIARSTSSLALGLAMRRHETEPGAALRVATGLVLLVFAASLAQGVLLDFDQSTKNTSSVQLYELHEPRFTAGQWRSVQQLPGIRAHAVTASAERVGSTDSNTRFDVLLATCAQLRTMVPRVGACHDGRPLRLWDPSQVQGRGATPGAKLRFPLADGHRGVTFTAPRQTIRYQDHSSIGAFESGTVVLPPSLLPPGARPLAPTYTLISAADPRTVRTVLDGIAHVAPTVEPITPGVNLTDLLQVAVIRTFMTVGMVLGLVIGVAAYLVAATDRAVEWRPQVTALSLLGAGRRTLRAVQVAQVVLPLAVGLALALVAGKMAESTYLITGGSPVYWDGAGLPVLLVCALAVMAVAALGALPLVGRRIDPELIRRD
ncbi:FtsX-like permease family protein [Streptomyces sp. NPDC090088]|uniref:FtsX-like permease family protein n=1 Tax=Streptomyces sp. NPDC090088 TaxID=3365944 RepID=UPI003815A644